MRYRPMLAQFRNLERLARTGGAMIGNIQAIDGKLSVSAQYLNPEFAPDLARLPPLPFESVTR